MLKQFWPSQSSAPPNSSSSAGDLTPRAVTTPNPFDASSSPHPSPRLPNSSSPSPSPSRQNTILPPANAPPSPRPSYHSSNSTSTSSSLRTHTPTHESLPLPHALATPGASRPTTGITVGDSLGAAGGFGLREPAKMIRALTKENSGSEYTAEPAGFAGEEHHDSPIGSGANTPASQSQQHKSSSLTPSPSLTAHPSPASSHSAHHPHTTTPATHPRGTLRIKLLAARNLDTTTPKPEPYVVVTFEQNEFVSRPPLPSTSPVLKSSAGQDAAGAGAQGKPSPIPRTNSYGPSLGIGSISRAFADAARRGKKKEGTDSGTNTPKEDGAALAMGGGVAAGDPVWKEEVVFDVTSPNSLIQVTVYDRSQAGEGFLGMKEIKPVLKDGMTVDNWFALQPRGEEHVGGEIWLQISYDAIKSKAHLTPKDFDIMKLIGRGTFGKVFQVRKRDTKRIYAMKMLSKKDIVAKKEIAHTIGERKILQRSLECPFLVGLKFSFQTEEYLFFITDYKSGGELFWHLQKEGRFTEQRAKFYIAELVLALEHLHKFDIVYRDLKPENILLDATGHVALCDFGLSKPDLGSGELTNTFCGTTEYLAPEVLLDDHGYSKLVDFWSLGVLLFEMCCGWSPFYSEDVQQMYKNICFGKIRFPRGVIDEDGKQFVKGLLNRNPKHRLGAERDAAELKEHPFFSNIDWRLLAARQVTPPFKPVVESDESVANFDPLFTSSDLKDVPFDFTQDDEGFAPQSMGHSYNGPGGGIPTDRNGVVKNGEAVTINKRPAPQPIGSPLTNSVQENFRGFTYTGESMLPNSVGALRLDDDDDLDEDEELEDVDEYDEDGDEMEVENEGQRTRRQSDVDMDA